MISRISSSLITARTFASSSVTNVQKIANSIFSFSRIPALSRMSLVARAALGLGGTALLVVAVISAVEYLFPSAPPGPADVPPVLGDDVDGGVPDDPLVGDEAPLVLPGGRGVGEVRDHDDVIPDASRDSESSDHWERLATPRIVPGVSNK